MAAASRNVQYKEITAVKSVMMTGKLAWAKAQKIFL
jgi:hypothetical protein